MIESSQELFLAKTVALELEQALAGLRSGLDFADALHHASCRACEAIASFNDRGFVRRIRQLNLPLLIGSQDQGLLSGHVVRLGTDVAFKAASLSPIGRSGSKVWATR